MRDIAAEVGNWLTAGLQVAVAIVVDTRGSVPRPAGTAMAVSADGRVAGNVSAGCVDAAVVTAATDVLGGAPASVLDFGISDEQAVSVGLSCGGGIGVLVSTLNSADAAAWSAAAAAITNGEPVALAAVTEGLARTGALLVVSSRGIDGDLGDPDLAGAVADAATQLRDRAAPSAPMTFETADDGAGVRTFITVVTPPPRMLVFGANDVAAALVRVGALLQYRVTVCDARAAFATPERFPGAADVVVQWPHRFLGETHVEPTTVICVLSHDPKFDVPALAAALQTPAVYIGMLGSRRTAAHRLNQLRRQGVGDDDLARIRTPVGLDLGGRAPEEIAVSIGAEIIALKHGGSGVPLIDLAGAIHPQPVS